MLHKSRQSGRTIRSTTSIRPVKAPSVDGVRKKGKNVQRITSGCEKLIKKLYERRHDKVAEKVH